LLSTDLSGVAINITGFAGAVSDPVPIAATRSAFFLSFSFSLPSIANSPWHSPSKGTTWLTLPPSFTVYQLSFFTGFLASALVYVVLSRLFPIPVAIEEDYIEETIVPSEGHSIKRSVSYQADDKKSIDQDNVRSGVDFV
jgi:hypothetical protein